MAQHVKCGPQPSILRWVAPKSIFINFGKINGGYFSAATPESDYK